MTQTLLQEQSDRVYGIGISDRSKLKSQERESAVWELLFLLPWLLSSEPISLSLSAFFCFALCWHGSDVASASGQLLPWRPCRCQLCAIEASGWKEDKTQTLGVSRLLPLSKMTKPKRENARGRSWRWSLLLFSILFILNPCEERDADSSFTGL